jgi:DNA-directed RNA polymerase subunit L
MTGPGSSLKMKAKPTSDPELVVTTIGGRPPLLAITDAAKRLSSYAGELLRQIETIDTA